MTNEQLYILIASWHNRLQDEISKLREQLPDDMERHSRPNLENFFFANGDYKVLDGLREFAKELGEYAEVLVPRNVSRPVFTSVTSNPFKVRND